MTQAARLDMYGPIHKALRAAMGDTLAALGRMDPYDDADTTLKVGQVAGLLRLLRGHLDHENEFLHAALEARSPGVSAIPAQDHVQHGAALASLELQARRLLALAGSARAEAAHRLYHALALFVAENFEHMQFEETEMNQALWRTFTDAELVDLHDRLVASIAPDEMAEVLRWMVPNVTPSERAALLAGIQAKAPAEAFSQVLDLVRPLLGARDWDKLMHAIAPLRAAA